MSEIEGRLCTVICPRELLCLTLLQFEYSPWSAHTAQLALHLLISLAHGKGPSFVSRSRTLFTLLDLSKDTSFSQSKQKIQSLVLHFAPLKLSTFFLMRLYVRKWILNFSVWFFIFFYFDLKNISLWFFFSCVCSEMFWLYVLSFWSSLDM